MADYLLYALIAFGCCLLLGVASFVALKHHLPRTGDRLGIAMPAALLAFAGALLVPPALVVLRGDSVLPAWTAVVLFVVLVLAVPSFWRSVLNRMAHQAEVPEMELPLGDDLGVAASMNAEEGQSPLASDPSLYGKASSASAETIPPMSSRKARDNVEMGMNNGKTEASGNLLADIARHRQISFRENLTQLPDDTAFEAVVELLPTEHRAQREPIPLVPEPVPPGIPFSVCSTRLGRKGRPAGLFKRLPGFWPACPARPRHCRCAMKFWWTFVRCSKSIIMSGKRSRCLNLIW